MKDISILNAFSRKAVGSNSSKKVKEKVKYQPLFMEIIKVLSLFL